MSMILNLKSLGKLRNLINEETEYRKGSELVQFFNALGFDDSYGQGFPSRSVFTDEHLNHLNGTPELNECIRRVLSPANFIGRLSELDKHIVEFNQYIAFDKWKVVCDGAEISFVQLQKIEIDETATPITEDEFLKREFSDFSVNERRSMLRIFLAHAKEDKPSVRELYYKLKQKGYLPWLDEMDLLPGQLWRDEIPNAIKNSDIFIACFSQHSVAKRGYVQREFRLALDKFAESISGDIYFIPLILNDCEIPNLRQEEYGVSLRDIQYVKYYESGGFERLIQAIEHQKERITTNSIHNLQIKPLVSKTKDL
jgi:hypothetical protein